MHTHAHAHAPPPKQQNAAYPPPHPQSQELVCVYDPGHASFDTMQPVNMFGEHTDIVTCLSPSPGNPSVFVSGVGGGAGWCNAAWCSAGRGGGGERGGVGGTPAW